MAKIAIHGDKARAKLLKGAELLAKAVIITLGPRGRNVTIGKSFGAQQVTKDGVTVAKAFDDVKDPVTNIGLQMVKDAASNTSNIVGDGTTTATLIAYELIKDGIKNITAGANQMEIRSGIEKGIKAVVEEIRKSAKKISTKEDIEKVALISTNNDKELAKLIAEVMDKVGKDGVVTVEEAKSLDTAVEYVEGMEFDRGYISPYFVTDTEKLEAVMEEASILITDKKLSTVQDIQPIAERILQNLKKPLVIIADDVDAQALATLVYNKLRGVIQVVAVKAPGFGDRRDAMLEDIAILTGGTVISEKTGRSMDNVDIADLGSAEKIIVQKENTIVVNGKGSKENVKKRVEQIKKEADLATSDYDKEKLQERLAKLSGGVAVINVGGATEVALKERKDRVDDALHATRAALEEGVVAGGGVALLDTIKVLDSIKSLSGDEIVGVNILRNALQSPIKQIAENAGKNGGVILEKCGKGQGYDARNDKFVDMMEAGIVDPAKVVTSAAIQGATVAALLITTEAVIADEPEKESKNGPVGGMPGGMGGMEGMM